MSIVKLVDEKILPVLTLSRYDAWWADALNGSFVFRIWLGLKGFTRRILNFPRFGTFLQILSYFLVALLFLILPAPQFADDKGILAIIVLAAAALRLGGTLMGGKESYRPQALDAIVLLFLGMNIVATLASHYLAASVKGLSKMLVYFVSYFLFVATIQQAPKKRGLVLIGSLLAAGALISLHGLYQYKIGVAPLATWEDPNVEDKTVRIYSFLKNPNLLAGYLVPMIPVALGATLMAFFQNGWKRFLTLPALGLAALITLASILTGSRGGWMGIAAGFGAMGFICFTSLWSAKPKLRPLIIILAVVIPLLMVVGIHFVPSLERRLLSIFAGREHSSNSYRLNVYASSIKMFLDSWWLGVGPGNSAFKLAYGLYMRSGFDALGTYCVPLEVAVETGVFGLFTFCWMVLASLLRSHQNFWNSFAGPERWLCAGAAAGLLAMMVHGLVDTVYYRPQVQLIFWLLIALCACIRPESNRNTVDTNSQNDSENRSIVSDEAAA